MGGIVIITGGIDLEEIMDIEGIIEDGRMGIGLIRGLAIGI